MLEKMYSKPAFDTVKSPSVPKANSVESARNGKSFQGIYAESGKQQTAVKSVAQPNKADTEKIVAADDSPTVVSTGVKDPAKQNQTDLDSESAEGTDIITLETADSEAPPTLPLGVVSFTQGVEGGSGVPKGPAANKGSDEVVLTSETGLTGQRLEQPPAGGKHVQTAHRSIAELRLTASQSDTTMPRQSRQNPDLAPQGNPLGATEGIENGPNGSQLVQGNPASVSDAAKNASVLQPTTQSVRTVETRGSDTLKSVSKTSQPAQTMAVMGTVKGNAQGLSDALQRGTVSEQEAQFASETAAEAEEVLANSTARPTRQMAASTQFSVTQTAPTPQTPTAVQNTVTTAEALLDPLSANLMQDPLSFEPAGLSQLLTEAVMSPGTTHRPETPRLVAVQLAEALATKGERNIDVALSPEELGRVKMRVSTTDTSVIVTITTERPETGDLMRRHINELAEEFRRMGFEDISFEFGGEGMSGQMAEGGEEGNSLISGSSENGDSDLNSENTTKPEQQNLRLGETGLDMRI